MRRFLLITFGVSVLYCIAVFSLSLMAFGIGMSNFSGGHKDTSGLEAMVSALIYVPTKISTALSQIFVGPLPSPAHDQDWTQDKQIALAHGNKANGRIGTLVFIGFALLLGCAVSIIDKSIIRKIPNNAIHRTPTRVTPDA